MTPILKKTQKGLPQFVTSHLPVTFLILEGVSFNVNQAGKTSLRTETVFLGRGHKLFSKGVEPQAIPFRVDRFLEAGMVANGANGFRITRHDAYANEEFSYFPFFV
jgi:hypothetical protein